MNLFRVPSTVSPTLVIPAQANATGPYLLNVDFDKIVALMSNHAF